MGESERRAYAEPTRGLIRLDNIRACNRQARGVADGREPMAKSARKNPQKMQFQNTQREFVRRCHQ